MTPTCGRLRTGLHVLMPAILRLRTRSSQSSTAVTVCLLGYSDLPTPQARTVCLTISGSTAIAVSMVAFAILSLHRPRMPKCAYLLNDSDMIGNLVKGIRNETAEKYTLSYWQNYDRIRILLAFEAITRQLNCSSLSCVPHKKAQKLGVILNDRR